MPTVMPKKNSSILSKKLGDKRFRRGYARLRQIILASERRQRFIQMARNTYGDDRAPNSLLLKTLVVAKCMSEWILRICLRNVLPGIPLMDRDLPKGKALQLTDSASYLVMQRMKWLWSHPIFPRLCSHRAEGFHISVRLRADKLCFGQKVNRKSHLIVEGWLWRENPFGENGNEKVISNKRFHL